MEILSQAMCEAILRRNEIGRLACFSPRQNRAYIVPLSYHYQSGAVYFACLPGQKLDFLREHAEGVCLEVEEVDEEHRWNTVLVTGRFGEPSGHEQIQEGLAAVQRVARGPLRSLFETQISAPSAGHLTVCALRPTSITGRFARWEPAPSGHKAARQQAGLHEQRMHS
ncbi:MAG TPA: pyridoxamine 5'-phosphate oxidase family protein [Chloroflexota bacterium]|nr:pyridoxamine 5'-phosphate oxidase family protein [Chloroflexota bacterium]